MFKEINLKNFLIVFFILTYLLTFIDWQIINNLFLIKFNTFFSFSISNKCEAHSVKIFKKTTNT